MTGEELFTRCPTCKTVFRTNDTQLAVQSGKVRCGQCRMVFDGRAHLVDLLPDRQTGSDEDRVQGPPTVTLRDSIALQPASSEPAEEPVEIPETAEPTTAINIPPPRIEHSKALDPESEQRATPAPEGNQVARPDPVSSIAPRPVRESPTTWVDTATTSASAGNPTQPSDEEVIAYDWRNAQPGPSRRGVRWALGISSALLTLLLIGQAIFLFRHAIAANYPQLRTPLVAACAALGCTIDALRRREEITIESHDLQADPAHQGLLILQLTLRNHASYPVAFPHLELEILDAAGQPQSRRALAPMDYAGGAADFARGMPANAEWNVKLFIDASSIGARGYNLDLFYP
jgi:predicted Zn finger-like uncharacterized protein